jgi:hypothetical protein
VGGGVLLYCSKRLWFHRLVNVTGQTLIKRCDEALKASNYNYNYLPEFNDLLLWRLNCEPALNIVSLSFAMISIFIALSLSEFASPALINYFVKIEYSFANILLTLDIAVNSHVRITWFRSEQRWRRTRRLGGRSFRQPRQLVLRSIVNNRIW